MVPFLKVTKALRKGPISSPKHWWFLCSVLSFQLKLQKRFEVFTPRCAGHFCCYNSSCLIFCGFKLSCQLLNRFPARELSLHLLSDAPVASAAGSVSSNITVLSLCHMGIYKCQFQHPLLCHWPLLSPSSNLSWELPGSHCRVHAFRQGLATQKHRRSAAEMKKHMKKVKNKYLIQN